ncbi:hypothetical protein KKC44_02040 [Patescibacteria group bacterium]|nr:hypothetical protein [Patescibacteria group bacterium]MBU2259363.1 hypothetical protein [Patescibacteria group bacterium]
MYSSAFAGSRMGSFLPFFQFHMLFMTVLVLGIIFFIVWASKNLSKDKLKMLWVWLIGIGIIGCLLTSVGSRNQGRFYKEIRAPQGNYSVMMEMHRDKGMKISDEDLDKTMEDMRMEMRKRMQEDEEGTVEEE